MRGTGPDEPRGRGKRVLTAVAVPLVILLVGVALAGCVGSGSEGGGAPTEAPQDEAPANETVNATPDRDPESPAATRWVQEHWDGREEIVVVDDTGQVWTGFSAAQPGATGACATPCEAAFFRPQDGALIPPGTDRLNVTVSWSEPPGLQLDLFYEPAPGQDVPPVNDVPNGEPFPVPVPDGWTDRPFQPASLWWFNLWPSAEPAGAVPPTDVQLRVVAERNETLPGIGPPPDRGNGSGGRVLVNQVTIDYRIGVHPTPGCMGLFVSCHPPDPGAWWMSGSGSRVAEDADTVRATLSWNRPLPVRPGLDAIHPGGRVRMEVVEDDPTALQRSFETSVPDEAVDSPWQPRSLWRFSAVFEEQGQEAGISGGSFTLTAAAVRGDDTQAS